MKKPEERQRFPATKDSWVHEGRAYTLERQPDSSSPVLTIDGVAPRSGYDHYSYRVIAARLLDNLDAEHEHAGFGERVTFCHCDAEDVPFISAVSGKFCIDVLTQLEKEIADDWPNATQFSDGFGFYTFEVCHQDAQVGDWGRIEIPDHFEFTKVGFEPLPTILLEETEEDNPGDEECPF